LKDRLNWRGWRAGALAPVGVRARAFGGWVRENDPVYRAFRRPGPVEKGAALGVLILVAALVLFLSLFDWNWLRGPIGRWASAQYDREIALNGDLDVKLFSWTPSVTVNQLTVGGPSWAREEDTARVSRIEASARLSRLLRGQIEMPLLAITRPQLVLIADEQGRRSWDLNADRPDDGRGARLPLIERLVITDGALSVEERRRGITLEAVVNAREAEASADPGETGFRLEGEGEINGAPLTLTIEGGAFVNIRRDRPYRFTAELEGARTRLRADGAITRPFDLGSFQARLAMRGQDLNDLYALTGVVAPNTPPYELAGTLTRDETLWTFADFAGRVGSSDLAGDLKVDRISDRLRVEADLTSRSLDLDDLAAVLGAQPQVTSGGTVAHSGAPGKLLPDAPLQTDRLRQMDGRLSFKAGSVKRNTFAVRQVDLGAALKDGILNLDPVSFTFSQGELNGTARIDATDDMPNSTVDFRLSGYPLEAIIPARDGAPTVTGRALGRAKLEGPGRSISEFAGGSNGSLSLVVPQGRIRSAFAELLGINVGAGLRRLFSGDVSESPIRCAVADFTVARGTATARTLVIDTDVVLTTGEGTIDLGTERMNIRLDGETKKPRLLRVWAPITVTGPLAQPQIGVDTGAVAAQAGITGLLTALVAPVAALFAFVDPGLAEDADCGGLIAGAR
jgi:AsmA family protein